MENPVRLSSVAECKPESPTTRAMKAGLATRGRRQNLCGIDSNVGRAQCGRRQATNQSRASGPSGTPRTWAGAVGNG